jgi:hypothetical protein
VTNLQEFDDGLWKDEEINPNESWSFDGTTLTKTETEKDHVETSTYLDVDGDGVFTKSGPKTITGISPDGPDSTKHSWPSSPSHDHGLDDGYRFTLADGQVTNLQEFDDGLWKDEEINPNESWSFDGTTLTKTQTNRGRVKTSTYLDTDEDGIFTKSGRDSVTGFRSRGRRASYYNTSSQTNDRGLDNGYRFTLVDGQVTNLQEFDDGLWKNERIRRNESWSFDGANLIQEERKRYGAEVTTFSDPDGDGIFSKASEAFTPLAFGLDPSVF